MDGEVQRPLAVTALDLACFPQREVGAIGAASGGRWQGVEVRWLLALSGVRPGARFVVFDSGAKRICLPLAQVSKLNALLALRREGRWLASEDGGPCRLVLQGSRWREFGGPIDRIQVSIEKPMSAPAPHSSGSHSSRTPARAA
ncbi:MAG: molybdopterin-dependent oxidoreductase [Chloroflexi bacterium]|nr:molybdopterin-dependent oxidoreductase [Chloroflexota bacterium]